MDLLWINNRSTHNQKILEKTIKTFTFTYNWQKNQYPEIFSYNLPIEEDPDDRWIESKI